MGSALVTPFMDVVVGHVVKVCKDNSFVPLDMYGVVYERYRFASYEGARLSASVGCALR